ncbi:hypothetical protein ILUMI_09999 [Ignelater luminosus]|uniref:Double-strand break repair protein n=1 Tax=Ignelater luminosus TaxID=2038154 RepID=A0A8K0GEJ3_IGNLU|nr:hypothetical protein ILUMI_09999 [Ignelater luminosus]
MSHLEETDTENDSEAGNSLSGDTLKILVATDIHLGYKEKDAIRGEDTFVTFEEILQQATKNEVDFILLGGDLFHESKPSPYCIQRCLELLRKYCLSDKPVSIEFLSDQSRNFLSQRVPIVNYEDPNLNIGIPVFSIHGNHDDPTGHKQTSVLDVLASTGLINYFGLWNDLSNVEIRPILLQKGKTKLALYGLSHIKDERLGRLFREKKVHLKKPDGNDWFNMLVLHQNRAARGVKNFIPDSAIPDFMDLVIWGHEHDCKIVPEVTENRVQISQPGSSVATSLASGESLSKNIGLLKVCKQEFVMIPLPLKTVRPFLIDELILENPLSNSYHSEKPSEQAVNQVKEKISQMIEEAKSKYTGPNQAPLPLLRLKVFYYSEQQQFNAVRIGMHFGGRVANPDDIIKLNSFTAKERKKNCNLNLDEDDYEKFVNISEWATSVEDVVMKYFEKDDNRKAMSVLSVKGLTEAVSRFVKHQDDDAFGRIIDKQLKDTVKQLVAMDPEVDKIEEALESIRMQRDQESSNSVQEQDIKMEEVISVSDDERGNNVTEYLLSSDDEVSPISTNTKKAAAKPNARGGRQARGSRGRGGGSTRGKRGKNDSSYGTLDSFCK